MTKEIICFGGEIALVDDEDYPLLSRFKWSYNGSEGNKYPRSGGDRKSGQQVGYYMHRLICGGKSPDHINLNHLDNRKENLRIATHQENGWNKGKSRACRHGEPTSRFKGVSYSPIRGKDRWVVLIKYVKPGHHKSTGSVIRVGYFFDEIEAAKAYNKKIVQLRGKWAWVNPIPE